MSGPAPERGEPLRFAVVMPTHNRPAMLAEALRSLQAQTYPHWEAIVVNDASTVDYAEAEREFADDRRIEFVYRSVNGGANAACNAGLDMATCRSVDFIAIQDDDDAFEPDYFEVAAGVIREHPGYGWFLSNNVGESKASSQTIIEAGELDYVDDYIYRKFRGDKGRLLARHLIADLRFDARFRASHRWPFFIELGERTKIWAFPHASIRKRYLEGGITRDKTRKQPTQLADVIYPFAKHWSVIRRRPRKRVAYRYFAMELSKAPRRLWQLLRGRASHGERRD